MKKFLILLAVLLLATAAFVAAGTEVSESDTQVGGSLEDQDNAAQASNKPIERLHLVANGTAISQSDDFNFMHARIVVGAMKIRESTASDGNIVKRMGVLMLDGQRYHLKDIAVSGKEVSAEIYGPATQTDANSPSIGEIVVKLFEKPGRDAWAGTMVLNGKTYNIYFLSVNRGFSLKEAAGKTGVYCEQNPDDSRCKKAYQQCDLNAEKCREKAKQYCESSPEDLGCLQLKKAYCLENASDSRCFQYLKGLCNKYPGMGFCETQTVNGKKVMTINQSEVIQITAEQGEQEGELIRERAREKINAVPNSISKVKIGNGRGS